MLDKEKVLKGLVCCQYSSKSHCEECPYAYDGLVGREDCTADLACDVLELLKEQEPVSPILEQESMVCGVCGHEVIWQKMLGDNVLLDDHLNYCPNCGRAVKWDD